LHIFGTALSHRKKPDTVSFHVAVGIRGAGFSVEACGNTGSVFTGSRFAFVVAGTGCSIGSSSFLATGLWVFHRNASAGFDTAGVDGAGVLVIA
jgi:hypothetical protein